MTNPPQSPAPSSASSLPLPSPDAPLPIDRDLLCLRCGYNLRTRFPADRCPECNLPVLDSLNAEEILPPRFFHKLRFAACLFAVYYLLSASFDLILFIPGRRSFVVAVATSPWWTVSTGGFVLLFAVGSLLFVRLTPRRIRHPLRLLLFSLALALSLVCQLLFTLIALDQSGRFTHMLRPNFPVEFTVRGLAFVANCAGIILYIFLWSSANQVTRLTQLASLRRATAPLFLAVLLGFCVNLAFVLAWYFYLLGFYLLGLFPGGVAPYLVNEFHRGLYVAVQFALAIYFIAAARLAHRHTR
jgi:hypothetical protein